MCKYFKVNGRPPLCTHDCDWCMWHENDEKEDKKVMVYPQVEGITPTVVKRKL